MSKNHSCPMCPVEIRNLLACAANALNAWEHPGLSRFANKMEDLRDAVKRAQPIADLHFHDSKCDHCGN